MIGLFLGKTDFPKKILNKLKKRKIKYFIIDLTKKNLFKKDKDSPSIAPRRFAVAINEEGVEVLTGPKSFASDTDVLIEEIKFRLDNQLP